MLRTAEPRVLVETIHGVTVASLADAEILNEEVIGELDEQLRELVGRPGQADVLLNFREVRLMSSSVLAVLLKFARGLTAAQGRLKLCCIAPDLAQVFKITRFDRLFEIYDEESAALDSF